MSEALVLFPLDREPSRFASRHEAAAWVGGFIDGEGSVSLLRRKAGTSWHRRVEVNNTDWALIEALVDGLTVLDIRHRVATLPKPSNPRWSQAWRVVIDSQAELRKVYDLIPLHSPAKKAALKAALATYVKPPRRRQLT